MYCRARGAADLSRATQLLTLSAYDAGKVLNMAWTPNIVSPTSSLGYWSGQSKVFGTVVTDAAASTVGCNRAMCIFTRSTPTGLREDVCVISFHIAKAAGPLRTFFNSTSDLNSAATPITTWWTSQKALTSDQFTFKEIRWYVVRDDQAKTGPPVRVDSVAQVGTAANARNLDQYSPTQTFITAASKNWGRVYLPGVQKGSLDTTTGRITTSQVDFISGYLRTLINAESSAGFELGVWSPTARSFLDTYRLQMDDVPDVQRRRRAKQPAYRKIYTS